MPINVNDPEYVIAEKDYHKSNNLQDRLNALRKMISHAPKHKGGENLRQQLTTRRKKLEGDIEKKKKSGKSTKIGIKKEDMQAVVIGFTNTGKSALISSLTNAKPRIAEHEFATKKPAIGMMGYFGTSIQVIEVPAFGSEYYDKGLVNTADTILILIDNLKQIKNIQKELGSAKGKQIILFNKIDKLNENEKRKLSATLSSKKYNFVLISAKTKQGFDKLKDKLFQSFGKIRVHTKEPGKEKTDRPIILNPGSTVKNVAEKILHGFSDKVKETKIWGPSSKFSGQKVGLQHKLKDLDVVEFKTK